MNVYTLSETTDGMLKAMVPGHSFIVHGADNYLIALTMSAKMSTSEVARHFCQFCGNYVPLKKKTCTCGHLIRGGGW